MNTFQQIPGARATTAQHEVKPLLSLQKGESATVRSVHAVGVLGRRLRDMGLLPGVDITVTGRAPLGCPMSVALEGFSLSLRCEEAEQILVQCQ